MDSRINTLRPRQNGRHFADDMFKCIFLSENIWIPIKISMKFVPKVPINNIPELVQIMAWRHPGDKPLSEPMMVSLTAHICVTRPQWVKCFSHVYNYDTYWYSNNILFTSKNVTQRLHNNFLKILLESGSMPKARASLHWFLYFFFTKVIILAVYRTLDIFLVLLFLHLKYKFSAYITELKSLATLLFAPQCFLVFDRLILYEHSSVRVDDGCIPLTMDQFCGVWLFLLCRTL